MMRAIVSALALCAVILMSFGIPSEAAAQVESIRTGPLAGPLNRPSLASRIVSPYYNGVSLSGNVVAGGAHRGDVGYDVQASDGVVITTPIVYAPVAFSSANVALVQGGAYPFSLLPAHVANGSYGSCLDCTSGGPCAPGGNGALALKTSAGWVCR